MKRIALYTTCPECFGRGREAYRADGHLANTCPACHGLGSQLTKEGRTIVSLIRASSVMGLLPEASGGDLS
jgi:DnaJ-class molecular chaperone